MLHIDAGLWVFEDPRAQLLDIDEAHPGPDCAKPGRTVASLDPGTLEEAVGFAGTATPHLRGLLYHRPLVQVGDTLYPLALVDWVRLRECHRKETSC